MGQNCNNPNSPDCLTVGDMTEELAIKTGGKSFFVDDNSGSGDINGAFTGSSTFQPGDTVTNTNVDIYEKDWDMSNITLGDAFTDAFDIDVTIGRDVIFQVDITLPRGASNCVNTTTITWVSPDEDHLRLNASFQCDKNNFGVFRQNISSLVSPLPTERWIYPGSQEVGSQVDLKLAVMADVRQGTRPVIGARVKALVERPMDANNTIYPAIELELQDNGSGADNIANDGVYARYFSQYTGRGRYSVKCQVVGDDDTKVNDGFITAKKSIPMLPGTP